MFSLGKQNRNDESLLPISPQKKKKEMSKMESDIRFDNLS